MPTTNEKVYIAKFVKEDMRPVARQLAILNRMLGDLDQEYTDNASSILAQYNAGDIIDEQRGNDGVLPLTKQEIMNALTAFNTVYNSLTQAQKDSIRKLLVTKLETI